MTEETHKKALNFANNLITEFSDEAFWPLQQQLKSKLMIAFERGYLEGQADATRKESQSEENKA